MDLDFSLTNSLVVNDALSAAIQELDMLMGTEKTQLICNPQYGLNMEEFLWDLSPSENTIKEHIVSNITKYTYWLKKFPYDIEVSSEPGTIHSIYTVKIAIKDIDDIVSENISENKDKIIVQKEYTYR